MKLDLNKFYNSNYKDFVHKEALEEALRMVAEIDLKDVEIDTILSITFSVDEFGENPMYVEYLDKDGKKHIVRIRPAVTNEIQEMLKRYVTLEQHEIDKQYIYNHFEHMHVPMEIRSKNGLDEDGNKSIVLNNDNSYLSLQVDPETDNEIQWLCIHNKGGLGPQSMYFARFMDYAKVDQVPSNADFLEKIHQLEELIQRKSQETLQNSKEYTDAQDNTLRTEITTNVTNQINEAKNAILSYVDVEVDNVKVYAYSRDVKYHKLSKSYTDNAKQEAVNSSKTYTDNKTSETLETSKTYTDTKYTEVIHRVNELENDMNTNFATKQELLINSEKIDSINSNKADKQTVDALSQLVQEIANKVDGIEIGERTKVNFVLSNSSNEEPINPTITSNDSYYVKVGSQYIISVYLTFEIDVTPTSTIKSVAFRWLHDLPGENPPLTLTAEMYGNRGIYSTTRMVKTDRNRVSFTIPAFPATEIYTENKITIYGTAITKDLSEEGEHND